MYRIKATSEADPAGKLYPVLPGCLVAGTRCDPIKRFAWNTTIEQLCNAQNGDARDGVIEQGRQAGA